MPFVVITGLFGVHMRTPSELEVDSVGCKACPAEALERPVVSGSGSSDAKVASLTKFCDASALACQFMLRDSLSFDPLRMLGRL